MRRGLNADVIEKLKRGFRYLLQSKLNTTKALQQIERDSRSPCAEVEYLRRLHPHLAARRDPPPRHAPHRRSPGR